MILFFCLEKVLSLPSLNRYSRPKHSDFYTLYQTKLLENNTLYCGTYPYSTHVYMRVKQGDGKECRAVNLMADLLRLLKDHFKDFKLILKL